MMENYLTVQEVATKLQVTPQWVVSQICEGVLRGLLAADDWRIPESEISKWLQILEGTSPVVKEYHLKKSQGEVIQTIKASNVREAARKLYAIQGIIKKTRGEGWSVIGEFSGWEVEGTIPGSYARLEDRGQTGVFLVGKDVGQKREWMVKMTVYGYVRVSTLTQLEGYGLPQQKALILKKYPDAVIIEDAGVSGTILDRPGWAYLSNALTKGDMVVVRELSRLWRNDWVGADIRHTLIIKGVSLVDLSDPSYQLDPTDPTIFLFQHIKEGLASFERMQINQKLKAGRQRKKEEGHYPCGRAPRGYCWELDEGKHQHKNLVIDPKEAEVIRRTFQYRAAGRTLDWIAKELGYTSRRMVAFTIRNPIYKGELAPAIVSKQLWGRAQIDKKAKK